jgi:hypothetical protein
MIGSTMESKMKSTKTFTVTSMVPTIDPELSAYLPPQSESEARAHEELILATGRADRPILVWQERGVVIDGHHTLAVCLRHKLPWSPEFMSFENGDEAKAYMLKRQEARRNMSPDEKVARAALDGKLEHAVQMRERMALILADDERGKYWLGRVVSRQLRTVQAAYNEWNRERGDGDDKGAERKRRTPLQFAEEAFLRLGPEVRSVFLAWAAKQL